MFESEDLAQYLNYKTRIELQLLNQQKGPNAGFFFYPPAGFTFTKPSSFKIFMIFSL